MAREGGVGGAMVSRIWLGAHVVHRAGREHNAQKAEHRGPQTIFLFSGSNYLNHGGCQSQMSLWPATVSHYLGDTEARLVNTEN